jgi:hypothetical protein
VVNMQSDTAAATNRAHFTATKGTSAVLRR